MNAVGRTCSLATPAGRTAFAALGMPVCYFRRTPQVAPLAPAPQLTTGPRARGAGRPAARPASASRSTGDSGDSDGPEDDPDPWDPASGTPDTRGPESGAKDPEPGSRPCRHNGESQTWAQTHETPNGRRTAHPRHGRTQPPAARPPKPRPMLLLVSADYGRVNRAMLRALQGARS